ncbi:MAG: hypothetical protein JWN79_3093 [Gemmatimonadetes bacterium]|jgi:hypothetical protein|nr:hypothetical protein [Gemmatimonadota bacterium]
MDAFGSLSVPVSIIIGLALAQLLQGLRGIALHRARVRLCWPVLAWSATLTLICVQTRGRCSRSGSTRSGRSCSSSR